MLHPISVDVHILPLTYKGPEDSVKQPATLADWLLEENSNAPDGLCPGETSA